MLTRFADSSGYELEELPYLVRQLAQVCKGMYMAWQDAQEAETDAAAQRSEHYALCRSVATSAYESWQFTENAAARMFQELQRSQTFVKEDTK